MSRKYTKSERWYEARRKIGEEFKRRGHQPSLEHTAKSIAVRRLKKEFGIDDPRKYPELVDMYARKWLEDYLSRREQETD
jgi:hypothetical protein